MADPDHRGVEVVAADGDEALWLRLRAYSFDRLDATFAFTDRLARENGWTRPFAERVVDEYRCFCFLALSAGHPVTPSEDVDQAWHLHLLYSRDYWERFCADVLQRALHHGPTQGGPKEQAKYHIQYRRTLDSYERLFGRPPPADIWPSAEARFRDAAAFRRVNRATHWVLAKPAWWCRR